MDFGVVHPIPLTVGDVMGELHVLDALSHRKRSGSDTPSQPAPAGENGQPCRCLEISLKSDGAPDVLMILGAPRLFDVATNRVQLSRERGHIHVTQMGVFGYLGDGHRGLPA